jgi:hypothetical protein
MKINEILYKTLERENRITSFEAFMAVMFQVKVFWVVTATLCTIITQTLTSTHD